MAKLSRFSGVTWHPLLKKWVVEVVILGGTFDSEEEAAQFRRRVDLSMPRVIGLVREVGLGSGPVRHN